MAGDEAVFLDRGPLVVIDEVNAAEAELGAGFG